MKVTVLGSGAWGTALAIVLVENGNDVTMWSHRREAVAEMQQLGVNPKLKGVPLPKELHLSSDLSCVSDSDVVVFATPSFAMRETAKRASSLVRSGTILVSVGKGIEKGSDLRMSQVIRSEISDDCPLVVLCGPTHAEEVGRKIPSGIVAASENQQAAEQVQDLFMNKRFRVYTSSDVVGVEICAALKNVIALCVGMSDGMGFGDNTRALIITRGLAGGEYTITETKAPGGYNKLTASIKMPLEQGGNPTAGVNVTDVNKTLAADGSPLSTPVAFQNVHVKEIENNKGTVLPETGGIGTTLFITLGALAVIGTGLFLVTNKRISKENF